MIDPITAMQLAWLSARYRCTAAWLNIRIFFARPRASVAIHRMNHAKNPEQFFALLVEGSVAEGESLADLRRDAALTAQRLQPYMSLMWPETGINRQTAETILRRAIQRKLREMA